MTVLLVSVVVFMAVVLTATAVCLVKGHRWNIDRGVLGSPAHGSLSELWAARLLESASVSSDRMRRAEHLLRAGGRTDDPELARTVYALAATRIVYWWNPWSWSGQALLFVGLSANIGVNPVFGLFGTLLGYGSAVVVVLLLATQPCMVRRYGRALDAHRTHVEWDDPRETVRDRPG